MLEQSLTLQSRLRLRRPYSWSKPEMGTIKFDVDAKVGQSRATIAMVVRE